MLMRLAAFITATLILTACGENSEPSGSNWMSQTNSNFAQVVPDKEVSLPSDHASHDAFKHEWWYFTANLVDEKGQSLGVQWTQFRVALSPKVPNQDGASTQWKTQQMFMAHSAITTKEQHVADERWSRSHPNVAGVNANPFSVYIDDWYWRAESVEPFPAVVNVKTKDMSYKLLLEAPAPYQKQGNLGFSKKSINGKVASYYFSQPFIKVSGEVIVEGQRHQVTGTGWLDREWSSQFLLETQQGWDWFALRLSEDTALVVFQLREKGAPEYTYARLMKRDGSHTRVEQKDIKIKSKAMTEIGDQSYPTLWQLIIPSLDVDIEISALNPLARMPLTISYWEGPTVISGSHQGFGYMELTGY